MTSNIPAGAIVALEKQWDADERFTAWFEDTVSMIADALRSRDDVCDAINSAWITADDEFGVNIEHSDIADAVMEAAERVMREKMRESA